MPKDFRRNSVKNDLPEGQQPVGADDFLIEGRNAVKEAILSGRHIEKLFVIKPVQGEPRSDIYMLARARNIDVVETFRQKLDKMSVTGSHQGYVAFCTPKEFSTVEDILSAVKAAGRKPFVVLCDGITDPHNLGAIIRSAAAFGADGIVIPKHNCAPMNAAVFKASAGTAEKIPIAKVGNVVDAIKRMKTAGLWLYAADMSGDKTIWQEQYTGNVCIVVGSEGKGISQIVKKNCDISVRIPMAPGVESLNVSVASALIMSEVYRQRNGF